MRFVRHRECTIRFNISHEYCKIECRSSNDWRWSSDRYRDNLRTLEEIVNEYGSDYTKHFDELLTRLGLKRNPRVIASGVIAYRETSNAYLKPYPDTIPILLSLRDRAYKIAVVSAGRAVKQWQKTRSARIGTYISFCSQSPKNLEWTILDQECLQRLSPGSALVLRNYLHRKQMWSGYC